MLEEVHADGLQELDTAQIVRSFVNAYERHDFTGARHIFNVHSLMVWFGIRAELLGHMLDEIVAADPSVQDVTSGFKVFLASTSEQRYFSPEVFATMRNPADPGSLIMRFGYLLDLRLRGHAREALDLFEVLRGELATFQPFIDRRNSWPQFLALQQGVTATIAGDFSRALQHFTECLARPLTPGLEVIHRNALVRSALIEASFGDSKLARMFLDRAALIRRSNSWAEDSIDASAALAHALLEPNTTLAARALATLDLAELGEMWPFYVFAVYVIHDRSGAHVRLNSSLTGLSSLPFPRINGEGFAGSVFNLALGCHKLYSNSMPEARELLDRADQSHFLTQLSLALYEIWAGDPREAIHLTNAVREDTLMLRRAELWRISLAAKAYVITGDTQSAVNTLRELESLIAPVRQREINFFTADVSLIGAEHFDWWPTREPDFSAYFERLPERQEQLTERELEVLRLLASGLSRPALARKLFISLNTLKTQLRTIYRKLGASSKAEALQRASSRGLL